MKTLTTFITVLCLAVGLIIGLSLSKRAQPAPVPTPQPTPTATSTPAPGYSTADWKTYNDGYSDKTGADVWRYSLKYPRDFDRSTDQLFVGTFLNTSSSVRFAFPDDAFSDKKTNFAEGWLTTNFKHPSNEKECYPTNTQSESVLPNEIINGVTYHVWKSGDAAAGNFYETKLYHTFFAAQQTCFEIAETIHTTNVGNYEPGTVSEFDKTKAQKIFDQIAQTITFATSTK